MATTTTNYGLTKPAGTEKYDISVFNNNADKIDTQMKANATAASTAQTKAEEAKATAESKQKAITVSTAEPTSSDGADGDLWAVYE